MVPQYHRITFGCTFNVSINIMAWTRYKRRKTKIDNENHVKRTYYKHKVNLVQSFPVFCAACWFAPHDVTLNRLSIWANTETKILTIFYDFFFCRMWFLLVIFHHIHIITWYCEIMIVIIDAELKKRLISAMNCIFRYSWIVCSNQRFIRYACEHFFRFAVMLTSFIFRRFFRVLFELYKRRRLQINRS